MSLVNKLFGKKAMPGGRQEESKEAPARLAASPAKRAKKPPASAEATAGKEEKKAAKAAAPKREEVSVRTAVKKEEGAKTKAESKMLVPHITEKASLAGSLGRYVFKVPASANKIDVAREVAKIYKLKVVSFNLINVPGKERRVGRTVGFRPGYRKAIVKLAKGQTIE